MTVHSTGGTQKGKDHGVTYKAHHAGLSPILRGIEGGGGGVRKTNKGGKLWLVSVDCLRTLVSGH